MIFVQTTFYNGDFEMVFYDYYIELSVYNGRTPSDFSEDYSKYKKDEMRLGLKPYYILDEENRKVAGFIVLQYVNEKVGISEPIWYIAEFYIFPALRRKNYGYKSIEHFIKKHHSDFFIEILCGNEAAYNFWKSSVAKLGLKTYKRPDLEVNIPWDVTCYCVNVSGYKEQ